MRFAVDPWDPAYGVANEALGLEESAADVNVDVEVPGEEWAPVTGAAVSLPSVVLFVDGVRRIDARIWIYDDEGGAHAGLCASFAAGAVRCDGVAGMGPVVVGRGVFAAHAAEPIATRAGEFTPRLASSGTAEGLALALQSRMAEAEVAAAEEACREAPAELLVVDGPLRGRQHLPNAVGYIKTHHVAYLPPRQQAVVGTLQPGQRTPLFVMGSQWSRQSWYARLPSSGSAPWSGVVRCECPIDLALPDATALADAVSAVLPAYASEPHKDPRAPQNLYPIAGLERVLRHRMGDANVVYRALRIAAG